MGVGALYFFFLTGSWSPLFFVILVFSFLFNYTPMEVVSPVGMLVSTAVYTLAADGCLF